MDNWSFPQKKIDEDRARLKRLIIASNLHAYVYPFVGVLAFFCTLVLSQHFEIIHFWARFGAMLILVATAVSGVALYWVVSMSSYFEDRDRRWQAASFSRAAYRKMVKSAPNGSKAYSQHLKAEKAKKICSNLIKKLVFLETVMLSIGTFFWGFADLAIKGETC